MVKSPDNAISSFVVDLALLSGSVCNNSNKNDVTTNDISLNIRDVEPNISKNSMAQQVVEETLSLSKHRGTINIVVFMVAEASTYLSIIDSCLNLCKDVVDNTLPRTLVSRITSKAQVLENKDNVPSSIQEGDLVDKGELKIDL